MGSVQVVVPDDHPVAYGSPDHQDLRRLAPYGTVTVHPTRWADRAELFRRIEPADVVINVRAYSEFDDEALAHAPRLKLISILGTGTDNVDLAAATRRALVVTNTPGIGAVPVAEMALGLMMAVARAIPLSDRRLRAGTWQHEIGPELQGKMLGLLGLGAIGQHFARIGKGIGMRVIGWSVRHDPARTAALGVELVDRDEVFRQADVVSIHLRNSPEVRGLVGRRELGLMKETAILINTARAAIVDQDALVDALRERRIGGAGLDVHLQEPLLPEDNPFKDLDNVVLTPHAGGTTREGAVRSRKMPVDNIIAFLEGHPEHVVNPEVLKR
ncbi:MAG TPA: NAD(P)-dependent oxidoreductase [Chloroflexota bacterium]|nr:NAD(P)-dependent oxidoreductase [Chloroflexota bacterium]